MTPADLPLFIESVADDQAPLVTPTGGAARAAGGAEGAADPAAAARPGSRRIAARAAGRRRCRSSQAGCAPTRRRAGQRADAGVRPPARRRADRCHHPGQHCRRRGAAHAAGVRAHRWSSGACCRSRRCWRSCCCSAAATSCSSPRPAGRRSARWRPASRVVNAADDQPARVSFRTAVVRTVSCLGSVLALGTGFLLVLFSGDGVRSTTASPRLASSPA